jgi:hypothetical protein
MTERTTCPVCLKDFACTKDMHQHLINKPDHIEWLRRELDSLRSEIAGLKEAAAMWRDIARKATAIIENR